MSHSHPIWNDIDTKPARKSSAGFGARDGFTQYVYVGTGPKNSHALAKIEVHRAELHTGQVIFALVVDGVMIKRGTLDGKNFSIDSQNGAD